MPSREFPFQQAEKLVADCKNIYQLETIKYLNMPLGHIVRSYLVDKFKTTNPSLASNRALVVNAVCDLINIYQSTIMEIKRTSANRIIVFNGRYLGPSADLQPRNVVLMSSIMNVVLIRIDLFYFSTCPFMWVLRNLLQDTCALKLYLHRKH